MEMSWAKLKHWFRSPEKARTRARLRDRVLFLYGVILISGAYGYAAAVNGWFPTRLVDQAMLGFSKVEEMAGWKYPWYYRKVGNLPAVKAFRPKEIAPGLTLITALGSAKHPEARVIDSRGKVVQRWNINWFNLWPDAKHLPPSGRFVALPGPMTHGVLLEPNGDLVFNLENAGLFRMNACGHVIWKLPLLTHHDLFRDEDGNYWVPDVVKGRMHDPALPGYIGGTNDHRLLKISPDGKVLKQWRIFDIFLKNRMRSYLYLTTQNNMSVHMKGDTLHLNDVDVFPRTIKPGIFQPGDVMISLRNINMVLVFDPQTEKVRHIFNGPFIRQHHPDFVDGNSIIVFDNYSQTMDTAQQRSRIVEVHADGRPPRIVWEGDAKHPFFSNIMGKQQLLPNGNRLLTEAVNGRALEIDPEGNMVWEYRNFVSTGVIGLMDEAQRLDPSRNAAFFARARAACKIH